MNSDLTLKLPALAVGCVIAFGLLGNAPAAAARAGLSDLPPDAPTLGAHTLASAVTWSGPLRVVGPVVVPPGVTLTLASGTRVFFDLPVVEEVEPGFSWLVVRGAIHAQGTDQAPVVFTPVGARQNPLENMVDVREAEAASFRNCVFRQGPWGLHLHDSPTTVEGCVFLDNYGGVRGRGKEIVLRANRFEGNRIGIRLWHSSPVIEGNTFVANRTGIFFRQEIEAAMVRRNNFGDVEYDIKLGELQFSNVDASHNWWGVAGSTNLAPRIFDGADSTGVGRVITEPRLAGPWNPYSRR